jgi:hypothetical protein
VPRRRLAALALFVLAVILVAWLLLKDTREERGARNTASRASDAAPEPAPPARDATPVAPSSAHPTVDASPPRVDHARGEVVIRGAWGRGEGQFGRKRDPESNQEGPMALACGARGDCAVLDQTNQRVQRFRGGSVAQTIALPRASAQDIAFARGNLAVLDRLGGRDVRVYDANGRELGVVALEGPGISEGGGTTGIFANDDGIYVEREHAQAVRIADADGRPDPDRLDVIGRPSRDGRLFLRGAIEDRAAGTIEVDAFDRRGPIFKSTVAAGAPILNVALLDADRAGSIYVGASVGAASSAPPYAIANEAVFVARLDGATGDVTGTLSLPPLATGDESFRPLAIDDDGAVYEMIDTDDGLVVTRYAFD